MPTPEYPTTTMAWRVWMKRMLDIDIEEGVDLVRNDRFPLDRLLETWHSVFSEEHGYSSDFIPALFRNKLGLLNWVYLDAPEPNWRGSD
jgi:hypothetical protein